MIDEQEVILDDLVNNCDFQEVYESNYNENDEDGEICFGDSPDSVNFDSR